MDDSIVQIVGGIRGVAQRRCPTRSEAGFESQPPGCCAGPGAGDVRRALVACERLVLLSNGPGSGATKKAEATARRDYAILLLHVGRFEEAKRELLRYKELVDIEGNLSYAVYVDKLIYRHVSNLASSLYQMPPRRSLAFSLLYLIQASGSGR